MSFKLNIGGAFLLVLLTVVSGKEEFMPRQHYKVVPVCLMLYTVTACVLLRTQPPSVSRTEAVEEGGVL